MAIHDVSFSIPKRTLGKDGSVLGTLEISNGSIVWFPKKTSYGYKMGWGKFDREMQKGATRVERR